MRSTWTALQWLKIARRSKAPIYEEGDFEGLRAAGRFNAQLLDSLAPLVRPGITTAELDRIACAYTRDHGHTPACLGYRGAAARPFAHSICTSVNDIVCHGVPDERPLREGDIINIDVATNVDGWFGDSSETFLVGECSLEARQLVAATREALRLGIAAVRPYGTVYEVGRAITKYARRGGYGVVRDYQGHGTGGKFHTEPGIPHYPYRSGLRTLLLPGMCFTLEPILNAGSGRTRMDDRKDWPVRTNDGSLSAQFEHTILLTEDGPEILTGAPDSMADQTSSTVSSFSGSVLEARPPAC